MPIVWQLPSGSLSVMQLSPEFLAANQQEGETTAQAVARLAAGEQAKNAELATATATLVTTSSLPADPSTQHQWRLVNGSITVDASVPSPYTNVGPFLTALKNSFTVQTRIAISRNYPWFIEAVKDQDWTSVASYLQDALSRNTLTQAQYDNIKALAAKHGIPVTL